MKRTVLLSLLIILAMALSACAGGGSDDTSGTEGAGGFGEETSLPGGGGGLEPTTDTGLGLEPTAVSGLGTGVPDTGGQMHTPTVSSGVGGTNSTGVPTTTSGSTGTRVPTVSGGPGDVARTAAPTTGAVSGTAVPTWPAIGTSIPATGGQIGDFARLSRLIGYELTDSSDEMLGTISDFIISVPDEMVDYVVVDRATGNTILVPWAAMMLNVNRTQAFSFSGTVDDLNNAPQFDSARVDFVNPTWDQDVLDYWAAPGGTTGSGTSATPSSGSILSTPSASAGTNSASTPGTSTAVPTSTTSSGMTTGTPSALATGTVPNTGINQDAAAVLFSELMTYDVVSSTASAAPTSAPSSVGTSVPGTTGAATSAPSTGLATGTAVPLGSATTTATTGTGETIGTVEDAVVNVLSGEVSFILVSLDDMNASVPDTGAGVATSMPSTGMGTSVPSTGTGVGTSVPSSPMGTSVPPTTGSSVPATGSTVQVIPIPMEFLRITLDNQVVLVAFDRVQQAPLLGLDTLQDPINMGWDAQYNSFWMGNGAGAGGATTGTATPQP